MTDLEALGFDSVVPHEGTWIEINITFPLLSLTMSFPTRERGLKYMVEGQLVDLNGSFPTRERGLK